MPAKRLDPAVVIDVVADWFRYPKRDVLGGGRSKTRVAARHVAMWTLYIDGYSSSEIAEVFGRDRTTVSKAIRSLQKKAKTDMIFAKHVAGVKMRADQVGRS